MVWCVVVMADEVGRCSVIVGALCVQLPALVAVDGLLFSDELTTVGPEGE